MGRLSLRVGVKLPVAAAGRATFLCAAAVCSVLAATADGARAADWPLRGSIQPAGFMRWDGWQFGVQAGYGNFRSSFDNSTSSMVAFILRNTVLEAEAAPSTWTTLGPSTTNGGVYGLFLGYNMQWDRLVMGFDLGYKHAGLDAESSDSISRRFVTSPDDIQHDVTITAQSSLKLVDYVTLRGRAGYAFGNFLPYAVIGAAAGRFTYFTSVTVSDFMTQLPLLPSPPGGVLGFANLTPSSMSVGKDNAIVGGVVAGLGMDWAITPSVFLRAEWEYIAFAQVNGSRPNMNTGNVGIGVRF